jgi:hypothetical protein
MSSLGQSDSSISVTSYQAMLAGGALLPPGGFGPFDKPAVTFHGVAPRSRDARKFHANRDAVEQARLRSRRGGYGSYSEPGGISVPDAHPDSAAYMADSDRFHGHAAVEERELRDQASARSKAEIARRREWYAARDTLKQQEQETADNKWDVDTAKLQADGRPARANLSGIAANPVTGISTLGPAGDSLRAADTHARARAAGRAQYLAEHDTGAGGVNIVTGAAGDNPVAHLAAAWGVPAPATMGITHATYVNASVMGKHTLVRDATRSRLVLRTMR